MKKILFIIILILLSSCDNNQKKFNNENTLLKTQTILSDSTINLPQDIKDIKKDITDIKLISKFKSREEHQDGTFIYQIDTTFIINVTSRVEARIVKNLYDSIPDDIVELFCKSSSGKIKKIFINVDNIVDVNLISLNPSAFNINKITNDDPDDDDIIKEWIWGVTPKILGDQDLLLKVTVKNKGINSNKIIFDKIIKVQNKPQRYFSIYVNDLRLKNLSTRIITSTIIQTSKDSSNFKWGGNGTINIEFNHPLNFNVIKNGDSYMNDDKSLFITNWDVTPNTKLDSTNMKIKIIGDNSQVVVYNKYIKIDKDFGKVFSNFVSKTKDGWYWLFTTLLIPLYHWIKRKYFPHKRMFTGKKRVLKSKTPIKN